MLEVNFEKLDWFDDLETSGYLKAYKRAYKTAYIRAYKEAYKRGFEKGSRNRALIIAQRLMEKDYSLTDIAEITGLDASDLMCLNVENNKDQS